MPDILIPGRYCLLRSDKALRQIVLSRIRELGIRPRNVKKLLGIENREYSYLIRMDYDDFNARIRSNPVDKAKMRYLTQEQYLALCKALGINVSLSITLTEAPIEHSL